LHFNNYGDKFGGIDSVGNLFFWKINKSLYSYSNISLGQIAQSHIIPYFNINKNKL